MKTARFVVEVSVDEDEVIDESKASALLETLTSLDEEQLPWAFSFDDVEVMP